MNETIMIAFWFHMISIEQRKFCYVTLSLLQTLIVPCAISIVVLIECSIKKALQWYAITGIYEGSTMRFLPDSYIRFSNETLLVCAFVLFDFILIHHKPLPSNPVFSLHDLLTLNDTTDPYQHDHVQRRNVYFTMPSCWMFPPRNSWTKLNTCSQRVASFARFRLCGVENA